MWQKSATRFGKKSPKCQKSQNLRFLISTVWKLLSEVEPYRTINNEVDVAKKCCQIWQKVAKVAKKCYQMWQKVAKGILRAFKGFQGRVGALRLGTYAQAPYAFAALGCRPKARRLVLLKSIIKWFIKKTYSFICLETNFHLRALNCI